jgi:5'/3'-nucleotidase SurE
VNDDGPPCRKLSPYVRPFVDALQDAGHRVSVAVPAASRSWIGKAHIIGSSLTATYVHPDSFRGDGSWEEEAEEEEQEIEDQCHAVTGNLPPTPAASSEHLNVTPSPAINTAPAAKEQQSWAVISNGTPASCTQLGIYELFNDRGAIDLIVSGPNHGRNASTIFTLSSGTVGAALEAATCGKRGIALSFGSKEEQLPEVIQAAARLSARLIDHLYRNWDERVELYNLNVPMRVDVESRPVRYTRALPSVWTKGSLYTEVHHPALVDGMTNIPNTPQEVDATNITKPTPSKRRVRQFQWSAELSDIKKCLTESAEGTDARTVLDGFTR